MFFVFGSSIFFGIAHLFCEISNDVLGWLDTLVFFPIKTVPTSSCRHIDTWRIRFPETRGD